MVKYIVYYLCVDEDLYVIYWNEYDDINIYMYRGIDICIHSEPGHLLVFQLADTTFSFLTNIFFHSAIAFTVNLGGSFARCVHLESNVHSYH